MMRPALQAPLLLAALLTIAACSPSAGDVAGQGPEPPEPPAVDDSRTDLLLSWFADGGAQTGSKVGDVPVEARAQVRVQDPAVPPEERDPAWVFLADLRTRGSDGSYPVRAVPRDEYEAARRAAQAARERERQEAEQAASSPPLQLVPQPAGDDGPVIMYANRHCPVCRKARRWLLDQKIPYVEKDIEKDKTAAMELVAKGKAQGVPTTGVPVFDVGGKLIAGFDKGAIRKALTAAKPPTPTQGVI